MSVCLTYLPTSQLSSSLRKNRLGVFGGNPEGEGYGWE